MTQIPYRLARMWHVGAFALALGMPMAVAPNPVAAQSRAETLVVVSEEGPATLDIHGATANVPTHEVSWNVYDRLVTHGRTELPDGSYAYDYTDFQPELAKSWDLAPDNSSVMFHLRQDATFHDGSPVTAEDVKWSLDRAVAVGGFPAIQMGASEMKSADQFVVIDTHTIRVDFPKPNKLVLANLAVPVAQILNSKLAKSHATAEDPWALDWVSKNDAGGGAYKIDGWKPGNEIVFSRFEEWKSGELPEMKKVIVKQIASAGTRRALLEKGDADLSFNLPPKDFKELAADGKLKVIGTPVDAELLYLDMNVTMKPFDNPLVRKAVAYAIPYQPILDSALYGRGVGMFGGPEKVTTTAWPQPSPYSTDLEKAKALLAQAGYPDGFDITLSYDVTTATTREPIALLIQDSLKKIGINVTLEKVPGADWYTRLGNKDMPFLIMSFKAWLNYPDYYFYWTYDGVNNSVFNAMNYVNPAMDELIAKARFETDKAAYDEAVKGFIQIAMDDVPRIPMVQDYRDVAMQPDVDGYTYWFHLTLDYRTLSRE
ncbi:ABC transporter substrate-binding protein [Sinirhodobacter sp. WL0062]|uniref:ABC transporter substrate-binding protein n=1 Tax=Rhodobacter flavimaris TaxID=2907145 RepID=A0ABS8YTA7_9RHOB|nr:ABC transporter substrate-binding protein [Sinirhodobacter sp. WL0062]MCE5973096.1 ABC transporter substrate-binding protein [Sinirhodobacter sp. WL0062]